jgi:lipoyl(octanoyl) transferase
MQQFTATRQADTADQLWLLQHAPVFSLGVNTQTEHLHSLSGRIPVVQSDRGGQVTYHGPGQLVAYVLCDIQRLGIGVKLMVAKLEAVIIAWLKALGVEATACPHARGVYVAGQKIASLGLRVKRGCCYHGISINLALDLSPFNEINPCGLAIQMTQLAAWLSPMPSVCLLEQQLIQHFLAEFGYTNRLAYHPAEDNP